MIRLTAEQRLRVFKWAYQVCMDAPDAKEDLPGRILKTYEDFCTKIQEVPPDVMDPEWLEKLETIEEHYGSVVAAAEALKISRAMFYKLKRMDKASPTHSGSVDKLFKKVTRKESKQSADCADGADGALRE